MVMAEKFSKQHHQGEEETFNLERGMGSAATVIAFPRDGCAWECRSRLELHGLQLHSVLGRPVVSQVSRSSVMHCIYSLCISYNTIKALETKAKIKTICDLLKKNKK